MIKLGQKKLPKRVYEATCEVQEATTLNWT